MADGPICIRRTTTVEEADIIVAWLADRELEARVLDHDSFQTIALGVTDIEGVSIIVGDQQTAARAETLLKEHAHVQAAKASSVAADLGTTDVTCGECGQVSRIPPGHEGQVVDCKHCGAYLDAPG